MSEYESECVSIQPVYLSHPYVVSAYDSGKVLDFCMCTYNDIVYAIVLAKADITHLRDGCTDAELELMKHTTLVDVVNPRSLISIRAMQIDSRKYTHITLGWDSLYIHYHTGTIHHYYDTICEKLPKYQWYSSMLNKLDFSIETHPLDTLYKRVHEAAGALVVNKRDNRLYIIDDTVSPTRYYISVDAADDPSEDMDIE